LKAEATAENFSQFWNLNRTLGQPSNRATWDLLSRTFLMIAIQWALPT
jgi:hypothetical protein